MGWEGSSHAKGQSLARVEDQLVCGIVEGHYFVPSLKCDAVVGYLREYAYLMICIFSSSSHPPLHPTRSTLNAQVSQMPPTLSL